MSSQVVIKFGAKEFKHNCATLFKVNGNNRTLIITSKISELQLAIKLSKCMLGSSLGYPLNWPIDCNFWNMTGFNSKLFARILDLTILKLKPSNYGITRFAKTLLLALLTLGRFLSVCPLRLHDFVSWFAFFLSCFLEGLFYL